MPRSRPRSRRASAAARNASSRTSAARIAPRRTPTSAETCGSASPRSTCATSPARSTSPATQPGVRSNIQVADVERVLLDEVLAGLDLVAHEDREDRVGLDRVLDAHLEERAVLGVHGRFPELLGVHLAEARSEERRVGT